MTCKILIVATIAGAIEDFILPFVRHFRGQGWQVDGVAVDITGNQACVAALNSVWDSAYAPVWDREASWNLWEISAGEDSGLPIPLSIQGKD